MSLIAARTLQTTASLTLFLALFLFSASFWGRLLLRPLGIAEKFKAYGEALPMVAFGAALAAFARYVRVLTNSLDELYALVFLLGALGCAGEMALRAKDSLAAKKKMGAVLRDALKGAEKIFVFLVFGALGGTLFCLSSTSGTLEPWLSPNHDYYAWLFCADYWRGFVDLTQYGLAADSFFATWDSFGTDVFMGFWGAARGEMTVSAVGGIAVTLFALTGATLYAIIASVFKLPRFWAFALALGLAAGDFWVFLFYFGFFGQALALFAFLTVVYVILNTPADLSFRESAFYLFFPFLFLYAFYVPAFLAFVSFALALLAFRGYFAASEAPVARKIALAVRGVWPGLAALLVSLLTLPRITVNLARRLHSVATQEEGFGLGLLDPAFFAGTPRGVGGETPQVEGVTGIDWLVYLLAVAALYLCLWKGPGPKLAAENAGKMKAALALFALSIAAYLAGYWLLGDIYQIWKFATYSILPLSFLFSAALFSCLWPLARGRKALFHALAAAVAACLLAAPALNVFAPLPAPRQSPRRASASPIVAGILAATREEPAATEAIIFDLSSSVRSVVAALLTERQKAKVYFINTKYNIPDVPDFIALLSEGAVIYSDRNYRGLFNGSFPPIPDKFVIFRYDYAYLREKGAIEYYPIDAQTREPLRGPLWVKVLTPAASRGKSLLLKMSVNVEGRSDAGCSAIKAFGADGAPLASGYDQGIVSVVAPLDITRDSVWEIALRLPAPYTSSTEFAPPFVLSETDPREPCPFWIQDAWLTPFD
ncbi:MAG: hypothetical protein LBO66_08990 [Deltaproteobacteria bacterium]|jgi:hypothetical protein|nr:hypothetical protein [Deltaproteobacteria bacterium]